MVVLTLRRTPGILYSGVRVNRSKSVLRRALAVAGAATLGLAGAIAFAAPASAHHPLLDGSAECVAGSWKVTWTVTSSENDLDGKITSIDKLEPADSTLTGITVGATVPMNVDNAALVGTQTVAANETSATLRITARWDRDGAIHTGYDEDTVEFEGTCDEPTAKPSAELTSDCEGVTVTLMNAKDATKDATFVVTGSGGFEVTKTVPADGRATVTVPKDKAASVRVTVGGKVIEEGRWVEPEGCEQPKPPAEPSGFFESTCDALILTVENPKDGATVTVTFVANTGAKQTLTVKPGETKSVSFEASENLKVTVSAEGLKDTVIPWEKPENCGGAGGGGPTLPQTGVKVGAAAAGALVLLAIGAGLFLVARRRRIRFTA
jgi:LPXTG-motif cell wall-anchored protein